MAGAGTGGHAVTIGIVGGVAAALGLAGAAYFMLPPGGSKRIASPPRGGEKKKKKKKRATRDVEEQEPMMETGVVPQAPVVYVPTGWEW